MDDDVGPLPSDAKYFSAVCRQISRADKKTWNRLLSIYHDALFVQFLQQSFRYPFVANLRCGVWYVRDVQETCYFKSTDGHHGSWTFSMARLNLHLLDILSLHGGLAIVDATRKGKRFPDALTKTVPIWIAVLNGVLFPLHAELCWYPELPTSEKDQLERRLEGWVASFWALKLDVTALREKVKKPMRPYWIAPDAVQLPSLEGIQKDDCYPVLLVSASSNINNAPWKRDPQISFSFEYVPGAADDEEGWSQGLTASLFWQNAEVLLQSGPSALDDEIGSILNACRDADNHQQNRSFSFGYIIYRTGHISMAVSDQLPDFSGACICCGTRPPRERTEESWFSVWIPIANHKSDKTSLSQSLPQALDFVSRSFQTHEYLLIYDNEWRDVCVCLTAAVLLDAFSSNTANVKDSEKDRGEMPVTKMDVKRALAQVTGIGSCPIPCRNHVKQISSHFQHARPSGPALATMPSLMQTSIV